MSVQRMQFKKIVTSPVRLLEAEWEKERFVKDVQVNEWIVKVVPGMENFSSV